MAVNCPLDLPIYTRCCYCEYGRPNGWLCHAVDPPLTQDQRLSSLTQSQADAVILSLYKTPAPPVYPVVDRLKAEVIYLHKKIDLILQRRKPKGEY